MMMRIRTPVIAALAIVFLAGAPALALAQKAGGGGIQDELDQTTSWLSDLLSGKGLFIAAVVAMIAVLVLAFRGSVTLSLVVLGLIGLVAIILPTLKSAFGG